MPVIKSVSTMQEITSREDLMTQENCCKCRFCFKMFGTFGAKNRHEYNFCFLNPKAALKANKLYCCEACGANFSKMNHFRYHKKNDCGILHKCNLCKRIFSCLHSLQRHKRICNV